MSPPNHISLLFARINYTDVRMICCSEKPGFRQPSETDEQESTLEASDSGSAVIKPPPEGPNVSLPLKDGTPPTSCTF